MKLLTQLRPAETLLLLKGSEVPLGQLLKLTFTDFAIRNVLVVAEQNRKAHPRDVTRTYTYVSAGQQLPYYRPKAFERVLLQPFYHARHLEIQIRHFIKMSFQNAGGIKAFRKLLLQETNTGFYFRQTWLNRVKGSVLLTAEGERAREQLNAELKELSTLFKNPAVMKETAATALKNVGGNALLVENLNLKLFHDIGFFLQQEENAQKRRDSGCNSSSCAGGWIGFDSHWPTGGCSGHSGCSNSGCSSGCSGSGCSGCGGGGGH